MLDQPGSIDALHARDRLLDTALATLARVSDGAFLHSVFDGEVEGDPWPPHPERLISLLPQGRWLPEDTHLLKLIDPSDHLRLHQAWLEACRGATRVAQATMRMVEPLVPVDGRPEGPIGTYEVQFIDLVGFDGVDAVAVTLNPTASLAPEADVTAPPTGTATFRLHLTREGVVVGGTGPVAEALGSELDDLIGTPIADRVYREDTRAIAEAWADVISVPERSRSGRVRLQSADGSWRWFTVTSWNALAEPDLEVVISDFYDIDDLVRTGEALQQSEVGFRTLAESMPVGVGLLDDDGGVRFVNRRLLSILSKIGAIRAGARTVPVEHVRTGYITAWTELVTQEFSSTVADFVSPSRRDEAHRESRQIEVDGPDGATSHLLVDLADIDAPDGSRTIVTVQDVTEEVMASQAHHRLVQVVDEVEDAVIVVDLAGVVSYLNTAATRFLSPEMRGRPLGELLPPRVKSLVHTVIEPTVRRMERWSGDVELKDLSGTPRLMAVSASPVADPDLPGVHIGITMRDVTAERAHARELAAQARRDPLTGLPNRLALMELLDTLRSNGHPDDEVALCFIDLDNLKVVNDSLGHGAGDRLLAAVADQLDQAAECDVVARFGGDEFVVVCEGLGAGAALDTAERLLDAIERTHLPGVASQVSASIGVATAPRGALDPERLVRDADAAMYVAKQAGRGRCALFDEALRRRVSRRFVLETSLRQAITRGTPEVHLQPIVALGDGKISGMEALSRWADISPTEFIPVAEDSGLIVPLGHAMLAGALSGAAALRASAPHLRELRIGANVSGRELVEPGFASRTLDAIAASDVPPEHVVLELTESVLIDPRDDVDHALRKLQSAGVSLALDDFGIGYSSLSYLRRYPIDVLKLDVSYTQSLTSDPDTRVIVEAICSMAARLGIGVVAEGVETVEQRELVRDLGVRWVQGFLAGRAAPVSHWLEADLSQPLARRATPTQQVDHPRATQGIGLREVVRPREPIRHPRSLPPGRA